MKKKFIAWILNTFYKDNSVVWNMLIDDKMNVHLKTKSFVGKKKVAIKGNSIQMDDKAFDDKYTEMVKTYGEF